MVRAPPRPRPLHSSACIAAWRIGTRGSPPATSPHRLDAEHPDKDGLQLRAISHVLKIFDKEAKSKYGAGCKVGVFFDYVSMPQRSRGSAEDDRTPEELAIFGRALKVPHTPLAAIPTALPHRPPPTPRRLPPLPQGINLWYGNPKTHVLLVATGGAGAEARLQVLLERVCVVSLCVGRKGEGKYTI